MSYSRDSIKKFFKPTIVVILCIVIFTVTVYLLVRPRIDLREEVPKYPVAKSVSTKITSEMNKLFKSCKDDNGKDKRYVIFNDGQNKQIYELANLSWDVESEDISQVDRTYNEVTFRGKIRLVRMNPDLPIVYRIFDPQTQSYSKNHEPYESCNQSNCVLSVEERNGELIITSGHYSPLITECNGVDTPLRPLEVDYLTTEQIADKKIDNIFDELDDHYKCKTNTVDIDQEQVVYYFSYIDKQNGDQYIVKTNEIKWKLQDEQSKELERVVIGTAVNFTVYKKKLYDLMLDPLGPVQERYESVNIDEDTLTQTILVKFVDGDWIVCISGEWTKCLCNNIMRVIPELEI